MYMGTYHLLVGCEEHFSVAVGYMYSIVGEMYGGKYWLASMKMMSKLHKAQGALFYTYLLVKVMNSFVGVLQPVTSHF